MNKVKAEKLSDEELVTLAQAGNEAAGVVLVGRYEQMVKNFTSARYVQKFKEDLKGELWLVFWELVKQYPVDNRSFREMVINRLYFRRMNFCRKERRLSDTEITYDESLDSGTYQEDMLGRLFIQELLRDKTLSKTECGIIYYLVMGVDSKTEIAGYMGIRRQSVAEAITQLRRKIEI